MKIFYCILFTLSLVCSLPIIIDLRDEQFDVHIDRLTQLIATHIQFDHLESVMSRTDQEIARQFQQHIQITTSHQADPKDKMDLELLTSQISAAIQAHTEGNLPLTWDTLAYNLSRPALETHIRHVLVNLCLSPRDDIISSQCILENAVTLASELEDYIIINLRLAINALEEALPSLLERTVHDLKGILTYFNSIFLSNDNHHFVLHVILWENDLVPALSRHEIFEHSHSSPFIEFASMARV